MLIKLNITIKNLLTRRSVRSFSKKSISSDLVNELLKVAMQSPTAFNSQLWRFIIINDRSKLNAIALQDEQAEIFEQTATVILLCADYNQVKSPVFLYQDMGAVSQNILIAAQALKLGAVWIAIDGVPQRSELIIKLCQLPLHIKPITAIAIGFPTCKIEFEDRFDSEKIHFNQWLTE